MDRIYRDVVNGKGASTARYVWEEEWAVASRDDVDGDSLISTMSSHRRKVQTTLRPTSSQTITLSQCDGVTNVDELVFQLSGCPLSLSFALTPPPPRPFAPPSPFAPLLSFRPSPSPLPFAPPAKPPFWRDKIRQK